MTIEQSKHIIELLKIDFEIKKEYEIDNKILNALDIAIKSLDLIIELDEETKNREEINKIFAEMRKQIEGPAPDIETRCMRWPDIETRCMRWPDKETFNKNLEKAIIKKTKAELKTKIKKDIDPETKSIFVTLKEIQNICAVHRKCVNCMFYNNFCIFGEKMPEEWEI